MFRVCTFNFEKKLVFGLKIAISFNLSTYRIIRIFNSPAWIFPMLPCQAPWTFQITEFPTYFQITMRTVTSWTQFDLAVGNIINFDVRRWSLHHFHWLAFFGGFITNQFDIIICGVQIDTVSATSLLWWSLTWNKDVWFVVKMLADNQRVYSDL